MADKKGTRENDGSPEKKKKNSSKFYYYVSSQSDEADTLKDKFWRNLEEGKIDVLHTPDLYSKVKSSKKAALGLNISAGFHGDESPASSSLDCSPSSSTCTSSSKSAAAPFSVSGYETGSALSNNSPLLLVDSPTSSPFKAGQPILSKADFLPTSGSVAECSAWDNLVRAIWRTAEPATTAESSDKRESAAGVCLSVSAEKLEPNGCSRRDLKKDLSFGASSDSVDEGWSGFSSSRKNRKSKEQKRKRRILGFAARGGSATTIGCERLRKEEVDDAAIVGFAGDTSSFGEVRNSDDFAVEETSATIQVGETAAAAETISESGEKIASESDASKETRTTTRNEKTKTKRSRRDFYYFVEIDSKEADTLKDPFWRELESGNHSLIEGADLYSKVKVKGNRNKPSWEPRKRRREIDDAGFVVVDDARRPRDRRGSGSAQPDASATDSTAEESKDVDGNRKKKKRRKEGGRVTCKSVRRKCESGSVSLDAPLTSVKTEINNPLPTGGAGEAATYSGGSEDCAWTAGNRRNGGELDRLAATAKFDEVHHDSTRNGAASLAKDSKLLIPCEVTVERLQSDKVKTERLHSDNVKIERLHSDQVTAERLQSDKVKTERLQIDKVTAERFQGDKVKAERSHSVKVMIERSHIDKVTAERLHGDKVTAERLHSDKVKAERLHCDKVTAEQYHSDKVKAERLHSDEVKAERLHSDKVKAERLYCDMVRAVQYHSDKVMVERLRGHKVSTPRLRTNKVALERLRSAREQRKNDSIVVDSKFNPRDSNAKTTSADLVSTSSGDRRRTSPSRAVTAVTTECKDPDSAFQPFDSSNLDSTICIDLLSDSLVVDSAIPLLGLPSESLNLDSATPFRVPSSDLLRRKCLDYRSLTYGRSLTSCAARCDQATRGVVIPVSLDSVDRFPSTNDSAKEKETRFSFPEMRSDLLNVMTSYDDSSGEKFREKWGFFLDEAFEQCIVRNDFLTALNLLRIPNDDDDAATDVERPNAEGATLLMRAVTSGHTEMAELLIGRGALVNRSDCNGSTPLMLACQGGWTKIAETLLESGSHIDLWNNEGENALVMAVNRGHWDVVQLLLTYGVNFASTTYKNQTAMRLATANQRNDILDLINSHINRLEKEFDRCLSTYFPTTTVNLGRKLFPLHCFSLRDATTFSLGFTHIQRRDAGRTSVGHLLVIANAFVGSHNVVCRLHGPCAATSVALNGSPLNALSTEGNFILGFAPQTAGRNELLINTISDPKSKSKLLVCAYEVQLM